MIKRLIKRIIPRLAHTPEPPAQNPPPAETIQPPKPCPQSDYEKRAYIYTLPKSGTYLWGILLEELGLINSGYHVAVWGYLDTLAHDADTNSRTPSKTKVDQEYLHTINRLPQGQFCFGHLCPMYFPNGFVRDRYQFLCTRRHPREILTSEFIDFRYRRNDVNWISQDTIADPLQAFQRYMKRHSHVIRDTCLQFLSLRTLRESSTFLDLVGGDIYLEVDFKDFLKSDKGPEIVQNCVDFLRLERPELDANAVWHSVLDRDNKTKASALSLDFDRLDLWTPQAEKYYALHQFEDIAKHLGY